MGISYRCSLKYKCGARKSLKHDIDWYIRRPKCPGCGLDTLKYDPSQYRPGRGCFCQGRTWPHNKGRIEDENHTCIHADYVEAEGIFLAQSMGGITTKMDPVDPCPF